MSADYPTDQDTPTVALLCECAAAPVEINQGLLSDGLLFATHNARGRYISTVTARKPQWLKDNPDKWQSVRNIQEPTVQLGAPLKDKNNVGTAPSWLMGQTSSRDGHEPTSLPTPVTTIVENGTPKAELPRRAEADASEVEAPKTETTPLGGTDRKMGRRIKKKLEAEVAKAGGMLSPERMRIVLIASWNIRSYPTQLGKRVFTAKHFRIGSSAARPATPDTTSSGRVRYGDFTNTANQRLGRPMIDSARSRGILRWAE